MHRDFLTAIWHNEPVATVFDRLGTEIDEAHQRAKAKLWRDKEICDRVNAALREPADSTMFQWARAYLDEAKKQEEKKTDPQLAYEAERREIEKQYLEEKQKEIEEMRQCHSTK